MSVCLIVSDEVSDDTWKKEIPPYSGLGTEGIGSVFQYQILLAFFADFMGVDYTFSGTTNLSHHSYTDKSENDFCGSLDEFFNLSNVKKEWDRVHMFAQLSGTQDPRGAEIFNGELQSFIEQHRDSEENILVNLHWCHLYLAQFCKVNAPLIFTKERVDKMRENLVYNGEKYFDDKINISWHVRTPNPNDVPAEIVSPLRELYFYEKDYQRYVNLITVLKNTFADKDVNLHIHSQGFTSDFTEFTQLKTDNFNIIAHLDEDAITDLYHMSHADMFVMSNSSFSWIASLLNSNQKIVRDNFTNGPFTFNSTKANYDFTSYA